jgi:hypothetical protein
MKILVCNARVLLISFILATFFLPFSTAEAYTASEGFAKIFATELSRHSEVYQKDSLTKEQRKILKKEERARRKAEIIPERQKMKTIDNPNQDDFFLPGESLPRGKSVLEAISGRVPGMTVSGNSVMIHGPSSFYGGMTPMFLVDDIQVSQDLLIMSQ